VAGAQRLGHPSFEDRCGEIVTLSLPLGHVSTSHVWGQSPVVASLQSRRASRAADFTEEEAPSGFEPLYEALQASA
jgi:hypothetical protein